MRGPGFLEQLEQALPGAVAGSRLDALDPWIEVAPERLVEVCRWLREKSAVRFDAIECITAIDWFEPDPKKAAKVTWQPHTELVYHLWSTASRVSIVLKVNLPRWKGDVPGQLPEVGSVAGSDSGCPGAAIHANRAFVPPTSPTRRGNVDGSMGSES